jgi:release factor glutamine methyltransferase
VARPSGHAQTVGQAVAAAARQFAGAGIENAWLEAEVLVRAAAELGRERLHAHPEESLPADAAADLASFVSRRLAREPLPYITGEVEFYSLPFHITPAAIVPRPETEVLVEAAVARARQIGAGLVIDVGTGSGALAVVLARELPEARVAAIDLSREALLLTRRNAARHGVASQVLLVQSDLLAGLRAHADCIVGNLPYVRHDEFSALQPEVRDYEPRLALDGGEDGLEVIRRLAVRLREHLSPRGIAALEVGAGQANAVANMLADGRLTNIEIVTDYAGIERVVIGRRGVAR